MGIARSQMNRQLYAEGTGLNSFSEDQQRQINEAFKTLQEAGLSREEAMMAIQKQLSELSKGAYENMPYYPSEDKGMYEPMDQNIPEYYNPKLQLLSPEEMRQEESAMSQNIPEYYDPRLQLLSPEEMQQEMQSPSMQPMPNYAQGGMIGRQQYGLGSLVKSIGKTVKSIASSPIGKAALLYAGTAGLGSLAAGGGFGSLFNLGTYAPSMVGSNLLTGLTRGATALGFTKPGGGLSFGLDKLIPGNLGSTAALMGGSALLSLFGGKEQAQEALSRNPGAVRQKLKDYLSYQYRDKSESEIDQMVEKNMREYAANGGRMGYAYGNSVQQGIMAAPQIGQQMGMPVGNPRQNQQGTIELDYRNEGGFVPPIGIKEKADDVPAMLSNNEFVFTADAVRNAGGGDINKGAQKMYTMMKTLENGGSV
jgi:hypothetical protein